MSAAQVSMMISKNDEVIKKVAGVDPRVLRAPYFGESVAVHSNPAARGRPFVQADVDPKDFLGRSAKAIANYTLRKVQSGSIILLHDIKRQTALAVPSIVAGLKAKGYRFVTVSQLLGSRCGRVRARVRSAAVH
jgi:peptidoglycan/xylan/chitin deacetylase (PgdA/CDA1 family)